MTRLAALALAAAIALGGGCASLLGLDDPQAADDGGADRPTVDAGVPDAAPDAIGPPCDAGTCPPGMSCDIGSFERVCRPVGPGPAGAPCRDLDDCAAGLSCELGVCRTICSSRIDCAPQIESECNIATSASSTFLCDSVCDPLPTGAATSCGDGKYCRPERIDVGYSSVCAARDFAGNLGQDVACGPGSCLPGYECSEWVFPGYRCMAWCDRDNPVCPPGTTCERAHPNWDTDMILRGKRYGLCKSPMS